MAIEDIVQDIKDARVDARSLSDFMFKPADAMITRRLAPDINSLQYYLDYLDALKAVYVQKSGMVTVNGVEVKPVSVAISEAIAKIENSGGRMAYKTYDMMVADKENIPANSVIEIGNDTADRNGVYTYDGTSFTKSDNDNSTTKDEVWNYIDKKVDHSAGSDLVRFVDLYGTTYSSIDQYGNLFLPNLDSSVQDSIKSMDDISEGVESLVLDVKEYSDKSIQQVAGPNLLELTDANGSVYSYIDGDGDIFIPNSTDSVQKQLKGLEGLGGAVSFVGSDNALLKLVDTNNELFGYVDRLGNLNIPDVITSEGGVNDLAQQAIEDRKRIDEYGQRINNANLDFGTAYKYMDGIRSASSAPMNKEMVLAEMSEFPGYDNIFAPSIIRTGLNSYYLVYDIRSKFGDISPTYVGGRKLTYNPSTQDFILGELKNYAMHGTEPNGMPFSYLNPNVSYIETGKNAGRILVHFNRTTNPDGLPEMDTGRKYTGYYTYSDDGGDTFVEAISMDSLFPREAIPGGMLLFGPGHGIQLRYGKHAGRLILPAYSKHPTDPAPLGLVQRSLVVYSDDGGDTYHLGADIVNPVGLNEWQVAENENGDIVGAFRQKSQIATKYTAISKDGGITFSDVTVMEGVRGAGIKIGFTQCANPYDYSLPKLIALSPRSKTAGGNDRFDPHIWSSYDGGKTWGDMKKLADGYCQYGDITPIDEDHILVLYGGGTYRRGNQVRAHIINIKFLIGK